MGQHGLVISEADIWQRGMPLQDAAYQYAPVRLRSAYDASRMAMPTVVLAFADVTAAMVEDLDAKHAGLAQRLRQSKDTAAVHVNAGIAMRDRLQIGLRSGKFVAYGYAIPRNPDDRRVNISVDLFEPKYIDWGKSVIKGAGLKFVSVLVFRPKLVAEIESLPSQIARRAIGRPPSQGTITAAIRSLIDAGWSPSSARKRDYESIRAEAHKLFPGQFV